VAQGHGLLMGKSFTKRLARCGGDMLWDDLPTPHPLLKGFPEYDPDQARGEDGRWTAGGGGGFFCSPSVTLRLGMYVTCGCSC
jgi:hypothetical protein